ncbi:hypothetical protein [Mucilaginibacter gynuensis]|uniref:hypothetical protein n=1 Tax=Mucilaginibacter gynuensis TaxID=1302236 RepID=UPI0031EBE411
MKTLIHFFITCFISTGALFGALSVLNPFPLFAVAFGVWGLFFWRWNVRMKRDAKKRYHERMFEEYMRERSRHVRF